VDDVEERRLELFRNRPRLARADAPVVHFADRSDLGGRAGKERLIGDVEVIPREPLFGNRVCFSAAICMIVSTGNASRTEEWRGS
jgi:hypothetical protein